MECPNKLDNPVHHSVHQHPLIDGLLLVRVTVEYLTPRRKLQIYEMKDDYKNVLCVCLDIVVLEVEKVIPTSHIRR